MTKIWSTGIRLLAVLLLGVISFVLNFDILRPHLTEPIQASTHQQETYKQSQEPENNRSTSALREIDDDHSIATKTKFLRRVTNWTIQKANTLRRVATYRRPPAWVSLPHHVDNNIDSQTQQFYQSHLLGIESFAFHTDVSTAHGILERGFPLQVWDDCVMQNVVQLRRQQQQARDKKDASRVNITISIVGGSSTAYAGPECRREFYDQDLQGRYSDFLQNQLIHDHAVHHRGKRHRFSRIKTDDDKRKGLEKLLRFNVVNVGHGATDSLWNAFMLDELINASATDVLIWEYATNDALGGTSGHKPREDTELAEMLNLWLWRVHQLFVVVANRPPPPLILVYLWDATFETRTTDASSNRSIGQSALQHQTQVIQYYQQHGWNIQVVNVGGAVDSKTVFSNTSLLLHDYHHPNCKTNQLIASMIRHVIYSSLSRTCNTSAREYGTNLTLLRSMPSSWRHNRSEILSDLLKPDTQLGSLMEWQPQRGSSVLKVHQSAAATMSIQSAAGAKIVESRADRKVSYTLPPCPQTIAFTMFDAAHMTWIGIGYGGGNHAQNTYSGQVELRIDGMIPDLNTSSDQLGIDWLKRFEYWIKIPLSSQLKGQSTLSFCKIVSARSQCYFQNATSMEEVCLAWTTRNAEISGVDNSAPEAVCPYEDFPSPHEACRHWNGTPEAKKLQKLYGKWDGDWGTGDPQVNWIVGLSSLSSSS